MAIDKARKKTDTFSVSVIFLDNSVQTFDATNVHYDQVCVSVVHGGIVTTFPLDHILCYTMPETP